MKKTLLLIAMVVTSYNVFAFTTQANWRWRNDDGNETTATWKDNQNTPITLNSNTEIFRLRLEIYNNTGGSVGLADTLQYATSTDGPWTNIDTAEGSNDFQIAGTSAFVTQGEPTTAQLTGVALSFVPGKIMVDSMVVVQDIADKRRTEIEWTIKGTANMQPGTTYYFREWGSTANPLDIGMTYPTLTTAEILPVTFAAFNVEAANGGALITWTTAKEENNSHFDIERSNDSKNYSVIATVKGNGTTSLSHSYKVVDSKPLNGDNYYRIKQYDTDGKYQVSDIRALKFVLQHTLINVFPNPSRGDINFAVQNYNGTSLKAVLYNVSGKMVHQELINTNTTGSYKLHLATKLSSGVYMLKLEGTALSEKLKVVIQ
jgi:hypothetical protein